MTLKSLFTRAALPAFILFTCLGTAQAQKYIQVLETVSSDAKTHDGAYVSENDTVKVTYFFWSEKGVFSFKVQNKTDKPLFIDWEQSEFKSLGQTFDYWPDNEPGKPTGIKADFHYDGPPVMPGYTADQGVGGAGANKNRNPRVSEIKPHGSLIRSSYYIFPKSHFEMGAKYHSRYLSLKEDKTIMTQVYELDYNKTNTPLRFHSRVTYSGAEDFVHKGSIGAGFTLHKVSEMELRQFKNSEKESDADAKKPEGSPYFSAKSFYIEVPAGKGVIK